MKISQSHLSIAVHNLDSSEPDCEGGSIVLQISVRFLIRLLIKIT